MLNNKADLTSMQGANERLSASRDFERVKSVIKCSFGKIEIAYLGT